MPFEDFKIDDTTGDITLGPNGYFLTVEGAERVAQQCEIRLRTQFGEWLLDTSSGMDWLDTVFVKNPDFVLIRARVIEQLRQVPDVQSVDSVALEPDFETRTMQIIFKVTTPYGPANGTV